MNSKQERWWSSSAGLCKLVPELESCKGWVRFAARYDDPEAKKRRSEAMAASRQQIDKRAVEIIRFAEDMIQRLPRNSAVLLFKEHPEEIRERAIQKLGDFVKMLLVEGDPQLLRELAQELERRKNPPIVKKRILAEGLEALRSFVVRMRRLPDREELSIEANRRKHMERFPIETAAFHKLGAKIGEKYILDVRDSELMLCHEDEWEELRWEPSEVTNSISKPGGLKLPDKRITRRKS